MKNLDFCVKHERCEHIFCAANQLLQIQRLSENNKSVAQNANVDFHLRAIGQQLKLLSRTSKDLKDEVNSIKQQTTKLMAEEIRSVGPYGISNLILRSLLIKMQMWVKTTIILLLLPKE